MASMLKPYCLLLILVFMVSNAHAQRQWMNGYLLDSATHFPIAGGTIRNSTSNKNIKTDAKGFFSLEAAPNDVIYALAPSYRYDTLTYSFLFKDTITIYLQSSGIVLPTITVTSPDNRYKMDSMNRRGEFLENRGNMVRGVSGTNSSAFGIGINLDRFFKKEYKHKRRYEKQYERQERAAYINYRFSPHLVAYYTGLKGDKLRDFLYRYTPTYEWLRAHPTNEAVFYYINEKVKEFNARK
jgi:hypothetical protein